MADNGMWTEPGTDPRQGLAPGRGEREVLAQYLEHYRMTLELKCDGLSAEQLAARSVPPSTLSLLGLVRHLAKGPGALIICGRFEGVDERVIERRELREVSLGDFVLSGGEPAALALLDGVVRLLPGVMGDERSGHEESFEDGLLEQPQYTRPRNWEGLEIPEILLSGDHKAMGRWKKEQREKLTEKRRADLWQAYVQRKN